MNSDPWKTSIDWLLEPGDIGVKFLTTRDLIKANDKELSSLKIKAHQRGPIAAILEKMKKEGYWERPGAGYYPTYFGTIWSVILLAQLGASLETDERIATACQYFIRPQPCQRRHF